MHILTKFYNFFLHSSVILVLHEVKKCLDDIRQLSLTQVLFCLSCIYRIDSKHRSAKAVP
jgi:hypothetical protein